MTAIKTLAVVALLTAPGLGCGHSSRVELLVRRYRLFVECSAAADLGRSIACGVHTVELGATAFASAGTMRTPTRVARADLLVRVGETREALAEYRRAEPNVETITHKRGREYARIQQAMGDLAFQVRDYGAAFAHFARAHDAYADALGVEHELAERARTRSAEAARWLAR